MVPCHARPRSRNCLVLSESDSHCELSLSLGLKPQSNVKSPPPTRSDRLEDEVFTLVGCLVRNWSQSLRWGLLWSIVSGVPFKFAKFDAARGVSGACWSRWVRSVGEVIAEANERVRREKPVSWATSQWDEVCFGSRKCQRGKRVRHSGPQCALTGVHVDGDAQWKCSDTWFLTGKRQPWHH